MLFKCHRITSPRLTHVKAQPLGANARQSRSGWEEPVLMEIIAVKMAQSKSRRQQISAVTRETNMETGTSAGGLRQG